MQILKFNVYAKDGYFNHFNLQSTANILHYSGKLFLHYIIRLCILLY